MLRIAFLGLLLAIPAALPALAPRTPSLARYAGQYRFNDEPEIVVSIFPASDHLIVEWTRMAATPLAPQGDSAFVTPDGKSRYIFNLDPAGQVTGFERDQQGHSPAVTIETATKISATPVHNHFRPYSRKEVMIPTRDGVELHAVIVRPLDQIDPLPFILERSPYGSDWANSDSLNERFTNMARNGYIFVFEDIRGRYGSQGKFVMMRPIAPHHDPNSSNPNWIDESTDTWDTVAWLVKHVPHNNGRVGVVGISYPGFLATEAGIDPNPAVKAISPQAPMTDVWLGDDFFHNGAFRETYGYDYVSGMESGKENAFGKLNEDAYTYFLNAGSAAKAGQQGGLGDLPTWHAFIHNPSYDSFWRARAVQPHLTQVTVPTLEVGGYWDQEDMWGPQEQYAVLKPHDEKHEVFMVLGPWNHGEWVRTTRHLGIVDFGSATGDWFRRNIQAPFFALYLKNQPGFSLDDVASFQSGTDRWMRYSAWPPSEALDRNLYLTPDHTLSFARPSRTDSFTTYTSDPANPVSYRKRPIEATYAPSGSRWYEWLAQDQRPYDHRGDVAVWQTPVLAKDVTVTGNVIADLFASTSGTDSDWVVKLIDVYPPDARQQRMDNYQLMIAEEIFRGRYRAGFEHPAPIPANQVEEYRYSLHAADHVFLKGHRIMVQVQSTWFPLYDRNPQTFVSNIMTAEPSDYIKATQKIYAGSHLVLPVVP
jgi:hypothetical protein